MSMKPGATHSPSTSRSSRAGCVTPGASTAMRPSTTPTSPRHGAAPVPSNTNPPLSSRSSTRVTLPEAHLSGSASEQRDKQPAEQQAEHSGGDDELRIERLDAVDHRVVEQVAREM